MENALNRVFLKRIYSEANMPANQTFIYPIQNMHFKGDRYCGHEVELFDVAWRYDCCRQDKQT